ncbi:MAG: thiamine-monophosphate kinase [Candidatus Aramenus sp.]|nr:thiamine-monophosphate kinase [Candidatus Aramenus sp.]
MKLEDIGEHEFINKVIRSFIGNKVLEDVFFKNGLGYKIDGFQLSYLFPFMDYYDVGWKAVTGVVSDLVYSLSQPKIIMASLGLTGKTEASEAEKLIRGIYESSLYYNAEYAGGDTNGSSSSGWIDVMGVGELVCERYNDIKEGDELVLTNPVGLTSNVFISYLNGFKIPILHEAEIKVKHPVVNIHALNVLRELCPIISYSTDVSDGVLISMYNVVKRFNVGIEVTKLPIDDKVISLMSNYGYTYLDILRYSGEEYEGLIAVRKGNSEKVISKLKSIGMRPFVVGKVTSGSNEVTYKGKRLDEAGWDNFKGWF